MEQLERLQSEHTFIRGTCKIAGGVLEGSDL